MRRAFIGAVLLLLPLVQAICEEQAGFLDWHLSNIGAVKYAQFAPRGRERVFVATQAAVVASLDTRDGSIAWRQVDCRLIEILNTTFNMLHWHPIAQQCINDSGTSLLHQSTHGTKGVDFILRHVDP